MEVGWDDVSRGARAKSLSDPKTLVPHQIMDGANFVSSWCF